jgi:hypothetical protein
VADVGRNEAAEKRGGEMTEDKKARSAQWPPGRYRASKWWLLVRDGNFRAELLVVDCGGETALPVFSGEDEAEMFLWLGDSPEDGWRIRETSAGELISVLNGPCARVGSVALDPSPEMVPARAVGLVSVSRKRFANWLADSCVLLPSAGRACTTTL